MKTINALFLKGFAILLTVLAPLAAFAAPDRIDVAGKNTWDLFTYGNGEALAEVLTSVTLMMAPDHGGGAYRYLLLLMATIGFLIMAVKAGFNPAQNFTKMFGFILLIFFVQYTTTGARANVHVYDRDMNYSRVIQDVPVIVAVPASVVSQVGEWLTRQMEQNFSIPSSLHVSGSGGQFYLFGKVLSDLDKFTIADADLKRTVSAYVADCVVPAMARGKVSANDMLSSANLMDTLKAAQHNAIMTRYYPIKYNSDVGAAPATCPGLAGLTGVDSGAGTYSTSLGALMSCKAAYECMQSDLENYASVLMTASSQEWSSNGVVTGYEQVMSDALARSGMEGRPQGVILQKSLISVMGGSFRQAAVRTGNNELMTASAIAQAEQSQKTSWWTAAEIFKNMMGYVYLVLQAFIFAVIPIVVVGLLIPGLGAKIFANYFQILIWLTLWMPMLALINFLITLFGGQQMEGAIKFAGFSMQSSAVVSERSNNLVIAAQFLATLVPLITWGLVKGAMAFTEFISHGIGSSFASQAGAQAATGNVSMGNLSMDNTGMSKYSTTMSSSVGAQSVDSSFGGGLGSGTLDFGGTGSKANSQSTTMKQSTSEKFAVSNGTSSSEAMSFTEAQGMRSAMTRNASEGQDLAQTSNDLIQKAKSFDKSNGYSTSEQISAREDLAKKASEVVKANAAFQSSMKLDGGIGAKGFDIGGGASWSASKARLQEAQAALDASIGRTTATDEKASRSMSFKDGQTASQSSAHQASISEKLDQSVSAMSEVSQQAQRNAALAESFQVTREMSTSTEQTAAIAADGRTGGGFAGRVHSDMHAAEGTMAEHQADLEQRTQDASSDNVAAEMGHGQSRLDSAGAHISEGREGVHDAMGTVIPMKNLKADVTSHEIKVASEANRMRVDVQGQTQLAQRRVAESQALAPVGSVLGEGDLAKIAPLSHD